MSLGGALEIAFQTDTGRVRNHNEDSVASDPELGLVVLADGMGGYAAGEVASAVAVTNVFRYTRDNLATLVPGQTDQESGLRYETLIVQDAVGLANDEVYRAALALFYLEDRSYQEIADILEVPIGTVMSRIARGRAQLQEMLLKKREGMERKIVPFPGHAKEGKHG